MLTGLETTRDNIKMQAKESVCYYELKKHKPWSDEGCSELLDQRKCYRMQATRNSRNKKREYLKDKINELETNRENKSVRDLYRNIN
jgi:hypothetical protein